MGLSLVIKYPESASKLSFICLLLSHLLLRNGLMTENVLAFRLGTRDDTEPWVHSSFSVSFLSLSDRKTIRRINNNYYYYKATVFVQWAYNQMPPSNLTSSLLMIKRERRCLMAGG